MQPAGAALDKRGRSLLRAESLDAMLDYDDEDNRRVFESAAVVQNCAWRGTRCLMQASPSKQLCPVSLRHGGREHGFEVGLFAELFREMLQQRFGRALFRGLAAIDGAKPPATKKDKEGGSSKPDRDKDAEGGRKRDHAASDAVEAGAEAVEAEPSAAAAKGKGNNQGGDGDVEMADAAEPPQAAADGSQAAAKRQKTEAAATTAGAGRARSCASVSLP